MESLERSEQITKALQSLGEPDTSIFTLFYLEEYKIQEIAEAVNLTVSNVKIRLMRGRKILKNKLVKIYDQI
ncbi:MAG: sigma-70 family RNA polymerase sigma factor [Saprospiraceae bacterium]|nr:sigma-70 family RNA polymerase sigma factor [Saprospiraceae bacterium]